MLQTLLLLTSLLAAVSLTEAQTPSCSELSAKKIATVNSLSDAKDQVIESWGAMLRTFGPLTDLDPIGAAQREARFKKAVDQLQKESIALDGISSDIVEYGCEGEVTTDTPADVSKCAVSRDQNYGTSKKPIRLGKRGLPTEVGTERVVAYLRAVRGPHGEGVRYLGVSEPFMQAASVPALRGMENSRYVVTYAGLPKPVFLSFDLNRWSEPMAPFGMICGSQIGLTKP